MFDVQRRLAAKLMKCGTTRVHFNPDNLEDIKEAITKADIRSLIKRGSISKRPTNNTSRFWARKNKEQKTKSKRKGPGSRKGKKTARTNPKEAWMNKIRLQRQYIQQLRNQKTINTAEYHELYSKSKGSFFRSLRHLKLYVQERGITKK